MNRHVFSHPVKKYGTVLMRVSILAYLFLSVWLMLHFSPTGAVTPALSRTDIIRGLILQAQMLLSIMLVLTGEKTGTSIALILNSYSFFAVIYSVFAIQRADALPGLFGYSGVLLMVLMIRYYQRRVSQHLEVMRQQEKQLRQLTRYDGLTHALNRETFLTTLARQADRCDATQARMHVVFMDIDNFKQINDRYGHHAGDQVLQQLTARIFSKIHLDDVIGRLGGDEIGLILYESFRDTGITEFLNQLRLLVNRTYMVDGHEIRTSVSMGVSTYPENSRNPADLLKSADLAMYRAKEQGKDSIVYCSA